MEKLFTFSDKFKEFLKNQDDDMPEPEPCRYCGVMAGACDKYPNCPNGPNQVKSPEPTGDSHG